MIYWQILAENGVVEPFDKALSSFLVFGKSYLEQLIWYYRQRVEHLAIRLPEDEVDLADRLVAFDDRLVVNGRAERQMSFQRDVLIDSRYVVTDLKLLSKGVDASDTSAAPATFYYYKKALVAISLPAALRQTLAATDRRLNHYQLSLPALRDLILELKLPQVTKKLKKRQLIAVKSLADIQRFMALLNELKLRQLLERGVLVCDLTSTWVEPQVEVGCGSSILPHSLLRGDTVVGENCQIGPAARIENSRVGDAVSVRDSTVLYSTIGDRSTIGPYAYLRPNSDIGKAVKIGDFVEVKNSQVDDGAKVSHLSYIGDGFVGKNVNIGCGTVFVNYDGFNKHRTVVEDDCFIGCNANLVAPLTVGRGAFVAAGSTITGDVAAGDLAVARSRQISKPDWAKNWAKKNQK